MTGKSPHVTTEHVAGLLSQVTDSADTGIELLAGGASDRWFARVTGPVAERYSVTSIVVMGVRPDLWDMIDSYLANQQFLAHRNIPTAASYASYPEVGIALIEDLGNTRLLDAVQRESDQRAPLYERTVDLLATLHAVEPDEAVPCPAWTLDFDVAKYQFEFGFHVDTWVIGSYCGAGPTSEEREELDAAFRWISERLAAPSRVFTHRDFQSTNVMVRPDGNLALVDFQDARRGLRQYDLASLLYDSYIEMSQQERDSLTTRYADAAGVRSEDRDEFDRLLRIAAIQRKLHDAGAWVYTADHRGKTDYLKWVPDALGVSIDFMLNIPECRRAGEILGTYLASRTEA